MAVKLYWLHIQSTLYHGLHLKCGSFDTIENGRGICHCQLCIVVDAFTACECDSDTQWHVKQKQALRHPRKLLLWIPLSTVLIGQPIVVCMLLSHICCGLHACDAAGFCCN